MQFSDYIALLYYYIGIKAVEVVDKTYNGSITDSDRHRFIICMNLLEIIQRYDSTKEIQEYPIDYYKRAQGAINRYLNKNIYYEY